MANNLGAAQRCFGVILCAFVIAAIWSAGASSFCYSQTVAGFGTPKGKLPLSGFGKPGAEDSLRRKFPKLAMALTDADRDQAAREIQRTDLNKDGIVTETEWVESGYQPAERFRTNDLNGDGTLTVFEHSMRWAQYRVGRQQSSQASGPQGPNNAQGPPNAQAPNNTQWQNNARGPANASGPTSGLPQPNTTKVATLSSQFDSRMRLQRAKTDELASFIVTTYDRNKSTAIERNEFQSPSSPYGNVAAADANGDGTIVAGEISAWLTARLALQSSSSLPDATPGWFLTSDFNNDGQVELAEYLRVAAKTQVGQFEQYDLNSDGIVTAKELSSQMTDDTLRFLGGRSGIIEANRDSSFELVITDNVPIKDINVQLAIVKNGDDDIEISLIGPNGKRAVLYFDSRFKAWGGGRLFDNTLIDDEAPPVAQRLPQPPANRVFQSQGPASKTQPGLSAFYGLSARGTWKLVIRNKSQVAGMLEGWALLIKPGTPPAAQNAKKQAG